MDSGKQSSILFIVSAKCYYMRDVQPLLYSILIGLVNEKDSTFKLPVV